MEVQSKGSSMKGRHRSLAGNKSMASNNSNRHRRAGQNNTEMKGISSNISLFNRGNDIDRAPLDIRV
jgi:hypothetical protein